MSTFSTLGKLLLPEFHSSKQTSAKKQAEQLSKVNDFMRDHYGYNGWLQHYSDYNLTLKNPKARLDYQFLADEQDPNKCGQLIANLATFTLTDRQIEKIFVQKRFKIINPSGDQDFLSWVSQNNKAHTIASIAEYYTATNPASSLPGIETWVWLKKNHDKASEFFKYEEGNNYLLLGSLIYFSNNSSGSWGAPVFRLNCSQVHRSYYNRLSPMNCVLLFTH